MGCRKARRRCLGSIWPTAALVTVEGLPLNPIDWAVTADAPERRLAAVTDPIPRPRVVAIELARVVHLSAVIHRIEHPVIVDVLITEVTQRVPLRWPTGETGALEIEVPLPWVHNLRTVVDAVGDPISVLVCVEVNEAAPANTDQADLAVAVQRALDQKASPRGLITLAPFNAVCVRPARAASSVAALGLDRWETAPLEAALTARAVTV